MINSTKKAFRFPIYQAVEQNIFKTTSTFVLLQFFMTQVHFHILFSKIHFYVYTLFIDFEFFKSIKFIKCLLFTFKWFENNFLSHIF